MSEITRGNEAEAMKRLEELKIGDIVSYQVVSDTLIVVRMLMREWGEVKKALDDIAFIESDGTLNNLWEALGIPIFSVGREK